MKVCVFLSLRRNVRDLSVPGLKVKYEERKHGDHTAGWRPAGRLLKVLLCPAYHTEDKDPASPLSAQGDEMCPCAGRERETPCWTGGVGY